VTPSGLVDVIHWLEDVFDRLRIARSYGGAIAYNYYGPPRLTRDIDVLVLLPRTAIPALVDALAADGCRRDPTGPLELPAFLADLDAKARFTSVLCFGVRVELFAAWHPFHRRVLERSPTRDLRGRAIAIHAPEDLIVIKKVFDRPKDVQDIKAILIAQRGRLDLERIRAGARDLLPDEGLRELEDLLHDRA
jgi:hypothetical protein